MERLVRCLTSEATPDDVAAELARWLPPAGREPHAVARVSAGPGLAGASVVTRVPFRELWLHYTRRCGYDGDFAPRGVLAGDPAGRFLVQDHGAAAAGARSASFVRAAGGGGGGGAHVVSVALAERGAAGGVSVTIAVWRGA